MHLANQEIDQVTSSILIFLMATQRILIFLCITRSLLATSILLLLEQPVCVEKLLSLVHNMTQGPATRCDVVRLSLRIDFFSILSDVVRLVAVGGDATQSYIAVLANFGMTSHRVAGPCDDLHHIVN